MATIDDFGDTTEPLNQPVLGGPSGWAAAVRDYITDLPAQIAGKLSKSGDTMTGGLVFNTDGYRVQIKATGVDIFAVRKWDDSAPAGIQCADPQYADWAATKGYVDKRVLSGVVNTGTGGPTRVTFSPAFTGQPVVVVGWGSWAGDANCRAENVGPTGFDCYANEVAAGNFVAAQVSWIATGPV